jgi:sensor domain CHASE-containing protein
LEVKDTHATTIVIARDLYDELLGIMKLNIPYSAWDDTYQLMYDLQALGDDNNLKETYLTNNFVEK